MTTARRNVQGMDQNIIAGIEKNLQGSPPMGLGGQKYTAVKLSALIQKRIALGNKIEATLKTWQSAVKEYQALDAQVRVVVADLRNHVMGAFGRESPVLAD